MRVCLYGVSQTRASIAATIAIRENWEVSALRREDLFERTWKTDFVAISRPR